MSIFDIFLFASDKIFVQDEHFLPLLWRPFQAPLQEFSYPLYICRKSTDNFAFLNVPVLENCIYRNSRQSNIHTCTVNHHCLPVCLPYCLPVCPSDAPSIRPSVRVCKRTYTMDTQPMDGHPGHTPSTYPTY